MGWTRDGDWVDDPLADAAYDGPLSPVETAYGNGQQAGDDLLRAADEYYGNPGTGAPVNIADHPGTNWYDPSSYQWLINPSATGTPPPTTPPPTTGGGGGGGGGGTGTNVNGGGNNTPRTFDISSSWPKFTAPGLPTIAPLNVPGPFSYDSFSAPTLEQAQSEPGYAFARDEGQRALENSAAARGTLRTGGTLKDLIGWGNRFAEQNYGNVYNRAAQTYDTNRGNALDAYKTNWGVTTDSYDRTTGTQLDLWDRAFNSAVAQFNPTFDAARLTFQDQYNRDRDRLEAATRVATTVV